MHPSSPPAAKSTIEVLYSAEQIAAKIQEMADAITARMGSDFMVIALLKGSFVFAADLVRALDHAHCHPQIDFMTLSSYGKNKESSGIVTVERDLSDTVKDKHILLIDDILESGQTLNYARELLNERGAKSLTIAVLLDKPGKRKVELTADFVGFTIPDKFVVGFGLDYANYYRELPFIGYLP